MVSIDDLGVVMFTLFVAFVTVDAEQIEVTACEGNTVDIRCLFGLINIISANYGRSSKVVCPANNNDVISDVNCGSKSSLKIVRSRCSNKKTCSVKASKDVFGDPCPVTYKYLQVKYECITPWDSRLTKKGIACENSELNLACGKREKILVLGANYGRTSEKICVDGDGFVDDKNCVLATSINVLTKNCGGKQQCTVSATTNVFTDPCAGVYKYLEVEYFCCKAKMEHCFDLIRN